jgi:hypothetical protein
VQLDALNDRKLAGEVIRVNQYAEPAGFSSGGVKKYAVFVKIIDPPVEIRPGMNASVSVLVDQQDDALQIPLEAIFEQKGHTFCLVRKGDGWETREIEIGSNNDEVALVVSGVEEDTQIVLNPRQYKDLLDLPEIPDEPVVAQVSASEATAVSTASASEQKPNPTPENAQGPPGDGNSQGRPRRSPSEMFTQFDGDGDGNLSSAEIGSIPDRLRDLVGQADADADGNVSKAEFFKTMAEMRQRREASSSGGGG